MFLGGWFIGADTANSFTFFSLWTKDAGIKAWSTYVRDSSVDDTIIGTTLAWVSLGEWEYVSDGSVQSVMDIFTTSQTLAWVDMLELVRDAEDPHQAVQGHINHLSATREQMDHAMQQLHADAQEHVQNSAACFSDKQAWDRRFFNGLSTNDEAMSLEWLEASLEAAPCYITHRIQANAAMYLAEKVKTYGGILWQRQDLLERKGDLLADHTAYLEDDMLSQLVTLKQELQWVDTVNYQQVANIYNMNIHNPQREIGALPDFSQFFPGGSNRPTYIVPSFDWH